MTLAFESSGSGLPLVFLHAFPLSRRMWDLQRPVLAKNFRFITPDLPGFGESPLQAEVSSMENMASQVLATLDQLKIEKFVVAGLSMGGYVTLQLLKQAPDRVRGVAFFSTRSGADSPETREKRQKNIDFVQKEGSAAFSARIMPSLLGKSTLDSQSSLLKDIPHWISEADPRAICAALRGMAARLDTTDVLSSLRVPSLFISGEEDTVVSSEEMESLSKRPPKSEFHIIPRAGHLINLEQPTLFNEIFMKFLKREVL